MFVRMAAAGVAAIIIGVAVGVYRYAEVWTPVQRLDLSAYLRARVTSMVGLTTAGSYDLLYVVDRHGRHLVVDDVVWRVITAGGASWILSDAAKTAGGQRIERATTSQDHAALAAFFETAVYAGQRPLVLFAPCLRATGLAFSTLVLCAVVHDLTRRRSRRLRGAELVTRRVFNLSLRGDGLRIPQRRKRIGRVLRRRPAVRLPRRLEADHLLVMGDVGSGKAAVIRQVLSEIAARGDRAIVYDSALTYIPEFHDASRGDVILNPLDERCPYWTPADELLQHVDALTVATSLVPDRSQTNRDPVTNVARRLVAELLAARPNPQELAGWLADPAALDARLVDTFEATVMARLAPGERTSVLSSLHVVADTLRLLPTEEETTLGWNAASWAWQGRGWIFLASPPPTRERLRPLISLWINLLMIRLRSAEEDGSPRTWLVLDDFASLDRLPDLYTAVVQNRDARMPIVLGVHGRSQVDARYGHEAEAMLSRPATKIVLRTSEPQAAQWIADTVGLVEIERVTEGQPKSLWQTYTHGVERQIERLVLDSEIMSLPPLQGFLKADNLVVPLHVEDRAPVFKSSRFLPRPEHSRPMPAPTVPTVPSTNAPPESPPPVPAAPVADAPTSRGDQLPPASAARRVYR